MNWNIEQRLLHISEHVDPLFLPKSEELIIIPDNRFIEGDLSLNDMVIISLLRNLHIKGDLILGKPYELREFPDDIIIEGDIMNYNATGHFIMVIASLPYQTKFIFSKRMALC